MKWCDLGCPQAEWPSQQALCGACRTAQALWCRKLKRLVLKNAPCQDFSRKAKAGPGQVRCVPGGNCGASGGGSCCAPEGANGTPGGAGGLPSRTIDDPRNLLGGPADPGRNSRQGHKSRKIT